MLHQVHFANTIFQPLKNITNLSLVDYRSSSIENDLKGYSIKSNGLIDSTLLIKIYNVNDLIMESALANLALDTKHKILMDETADVDSPIVLKCDTALLNYTINHCINWSDNQKK